MHINSVKSPYGMAIKTSQEELDEMLIEALLTGKVLKWNGAPVEGN